MGSTGCCGVVKVQGVIVFAEEDVVNFMAETVSVVQAA